MKILAIDDSPTLRKFISKHLTAYSDSYEVLLAATGEEGVASAVENQPDLILLDFILPDINGDEVCRRLLDEENTASIPVILMSSSAPDIEKNEGKFSNIIRSLIKPFSPQLLCASSSSALKKAAGAAPASSEGDTTESKAPSDATTGDKDTITATTENVLLCGKASYFSMADVLLGIEQENATGILYLDIPSGKREVYFREGKPTLSSTTQVDLYLECGKLSIPDESIEYFETAKKKQAESGNPVFIQMAEDGSLEQDQAATLTAQYGNVLFAEVWTAPESAFKFIQTDPLPDFVPVEPIKDNALHWITTTLRNVNTDAPSVSSIAKPEDILSFTAEGYQKIQIMSLTQEEVAFITRMGEGNSSIGEIIASLNLEWTDASGIIFLLKKTNIIDIWPSA